MHEVGSAGLAALDAGSYIENWFILFDFPSGLHGFHLGAGPIELNGVTYNGAKSLFTIEQVDATADLSASPITVTLRSVPNTALTPDVLATIHDEDYKNRPVTLTRVLFSRATGEIVHAFRWWGGFVDTVEEVETVGGDAAIVGTFEPRSLDHSRRGYRVRGDADQKLIDPADRFFEHAATAPTEKLPYGRRDAITPAAGGVGGGSAFRTG